MVALVSDPMPKSPAQPGKIPTLPPCTYQSLISFQTDAVLTVGFNGGSLFKPCPPPPGGSYGSLLYIGGNVWEVDIFAPPKHWGARLALSCPGVNPSGTLTLFYADTTGTYTGDYAATTTTDGEGIFLVQIAGEQPTSVGVSQI